MSESETWGLEPGPDGARRCWWCLSAPEYIAYHDHEWGKPVRDDRHLFELLTLESFQSGLSWLTILRKRDGFRRAFANFEIDAVAAFGPADVARLLADAEIVRHRGKIEAAINNAQAAIELRAQGESLSELLWRFAPDQRVAPLPRSGHELPSQTADSGAIAKALKARGFRFFGPTTAYSLMQAAGLVNDHLDGCAFAARGPG